MLEPREADVPVLILVLVVLPLVTYVLLGKWNDVSKKRVRISLLAELVAEEARGADAIATASFTPLVPTPTNEFQLSTSKNEFNVSTSKNGFHACARCFAPATTRCSRCKSVRYCSGKCQIIHWRQVHKQECQQLEKISSSSSPLAASIEDSVVHNERFNSQLSGYNNKLVGTGKAPPDDIFHSSTSRCTDATKDCSTFDTSQTFMLERRPAEKRFYHKLDRELLRRKDEIVFDFHDEMSRISSCSADSTSCSNFSPKEASIRHKLKTSASAVSAEETLRNRYFKHFNGYTYGQVTAGNTTHESHGYQSQHASIYEPRNSAKCGTYAPEEEIDFTCNGGNFLKEENEFIDESIQYDGSQAMNGHIKAGNAMNPLGPKAYKSAKSCKKVVGEQSCSEKERKGPITDESKVARVRDTTPTQGSKEVRSMGIMKMMGLRKSNKLRQDVSELFHNQHRKIKMLFPYEEFVILFQYDVPDLSPRGLLNCGNSFEVLLKYDRHKKFDMTVLNGPVVMRIDCCYANAVLQCLTCTKPLVIYLLCRSHSSACCRKDWCLMCELEQHILMLRESGVPLSPGRILLHMRTISCQIGDGSQEDAHEFLRLLVASMQSICLERHGGENKVDPRLQETTFIQHTFGGRLWSKVKCLRCHHESERYENIMDLTLEIFGWVESLEDALTQFTTPEDLDGENMYKCARCASYVRARKQLSIHEAPNILTIVLKRFQEGRYGKINKCITFPELLDMAPFMTRTGDTPPLYVLYAVAVHLDTQNASFSGHYVSYVKDMRGTWFRIDDTEVHPVPMSQVMSEGAYILFYMRSCPRPQRAVSGKAMRQQVPASLRHSTLKTQKLLRQGQNNPSSRYVGPESLSDLRPEIINDFTEHTSNGLIRQGAHKNMLPVFERYPEPASMEFPESASSDWSLFTSSDEASFTTESARDSFSTVDYADACNPESASRNTICCRTFLRSKPQTRFISSETGYVLDSYLSTQSQNKARRGENLRQFSDSSTELSSDSNCEIFVNYESS